MNEGTFLKDEKDVLKLLLSIRFKKDCHNCITGDYINSMFYDKYGNNATCRFCNVHLNNDYKLFFEEMTLIAKAMKNRLIEKQVKHGDSWKTDAIDWLRTRVIRMYLLWKNERSETELEKTSLIDIANQSMLLYLRLLEKEISLKEGIL